MEVLKSVKTQLGNKVELIGDFDIERPSALIIGVFHGDEPQGKYLIEKYLESVLPLLEIKDFGPPSRGGHEDISDLGSSTIGGHEDICSLERGHVVSSNFSKHKYNKNLIQIGKNLRNNSTKPEIILWQHLKEKQLGFKFRRQQPIGNYIPDFVCNERKLIIELYGGQHNSATEIEKDKIRDDFFDSLGYKVLRIWNNYVYENLDGVIDYIKENLNPTSQPLVKEHKSDATSCPPLEEGPKSLISRRGKVRGRAKNLIFIPCLNPDGMQLGQRTNANGVDLNRNFPTKNWGEDTSAAGDNPSDYFGGNSAGSEIETKFVMEVIEQYKPTNILTLHAPYKVVNYDGPAENLAQKISDIIKYPVEASIGYPTPGSFGTYAGIERQISTITLELDETCPVESLVAPIFEVFDLLNVI